MDAIDEQDTRRGSFSSRRVFILAAIGSAVGLGNIWRFPYVAYENGGGAFLLPYLIALLTAGIPFLLLDYGLGHRFRGSAPLSFARLRRWTEGIGWWQVLICFVIAVYYAAVIAWAASYTVFSFDTSWGEDTEAFFTGEYLQVSDPGVTMDIVPGVLIPLALVWLVLLVVMGLGVQRGVGRTAVVFIPVLFVTFLALVVRSLFLDGAAQGLDAFFAPEWSALADAGVWAAAFGQIFFSLSVGFGIMITYASYVGRRENMTGSALVVGFSNSGFELLAGIGIFSALGFMAQASGVNIAEVATSGVGLAFMGFPAIINQSPGGALLGVLFFGSLVLAGITSLISVLEVVISGVRDKLELSRVAATLGVVVPSAVISLALFSTTSGLYVLDITDHWVNQYGILPAAVVSMVVIAWLVRGLPALAHHLNRDGSVRMGTWWYLLIGGVAPIALVVVLVQAFIEDVQEAYEGYPAWLLGTFGWGMSGLIIVLAIGAGFLRWRAGTDLEIRDDAPEDSGAAAAAGGAGHGEKGAQS